jgi:hypothetical protein
VRCGRRPFGSTGGVAAETVERRAMPTKVYHPAAIVAGIVYWLWGAAWYTVFGSQWLALTHLTQAERNPAAPGPYVTSVLMAFVLSYGTAVALCHDEQRTALHGIQFGVFVGFLFLASTMLTAYVYEGRPLGLWVLNSSYEIVGLAIVGAIIGGWKGRISVRR